MRDVRESAEELQRARRAFIAADRTWSSFDNSDTYVEAILWCRREEARTALGALLAKERSSFETSETEGEREGASSEGLLA